MVERRLDFAAAAMDGVLVAGRPEGLWRRIAIDTRKIAGGELFFALPGERVDGHDFVGEAHRRRAAAAVVHKDVEKAGAAIRVSDTFAALHALTRAVRREVPRRLVGLTGSTGKTTTKELLAAVLARRFRVAKSPGNLNNLYGFPVSLMAVDDDCEWMVAEMGMSTPGELRAISLLGRPDAVVFTNVRAVHLENFPSLDAIAEAKAEILAGLAEDGLVIANADDPRVMRISAGRRRITYGFGEGADVRASAPRPLGERPGSAFTLHAGGETAEVVLPLHGLYNAENALAAAACGHALGVPLAEAAAALAGAEPAEHRGIVHRGVACRRGAITVVDDCYNSNPDAAAKALESARALPASRYVAVLGDMLELGPDEVALHRRLGEEAAGLGFDPIVAVGPLAAEMAAASERFPTAGEAAGWIRGALRDGDCVLVKGSRGVGLEVVVEALLTAEDASGEVA